MEGGEMMNVSAVDVFFSIMILALFIRIFWNPIKRTHQMSHEYEKLIKLEKELETRDLNQFELEELRREFQKHKRKP